MPAIQITFEQIIPGSHPILLRGLADNPNDLTDTEIKKLVQSWEGFQPGNTVQFTNEKGMLFYFFFDSTNDSYRGYAFAAGFLSGRKGF